MATKEQVELKIMLQELIDKAFLLGVHRCSLFGRKMDRFDYVWTIES